MFHVEHIFSHNPMNIKGKIIDIHSRRIHPAEITINGGLITSVKEINSAPDVYIMPGFADAHLHIESSMVVPSHFAAAAVKHGTIAVVADPHEIANVTGRAGVDYMIENGATVPLKIVFGAPSCVPAIPGESAGARIGSGDIKEMLREGNVKFLSEMMNYPGVITNDPEVHQKLAAAREAGVPIDGHAPGLTGEELATYIKAGIQTDHECASLQEAIEKIEGGMKILIREGSAARNLEELAPLISSYPDRVMLCTDDLHPETLEKGHINLLVARLLVLGYDIYDVIRAASMNTFIHYNINAGMLREGDPADFIVTDDISSMRIVQTWIGGKKVYDGENTLFNTGTVKKINKFKATKLFSEEIRVINEAGNINLIVAVNGDLNTGSETFKAKEESFVSTRAEEDILKIVVKERYNDKPPAVGFIRGFGIKKGAMATSVAHDSHNIIAVGVNDEEITTAINMIIDARGGMSIVSDDFTAILRLPVAGIMSDRPVSVVAKQYRVLSEKAKELGSALDAPFMTLSFMSLLVIPKLKISDKGLFDVDQFKYIPLFKPDPYAKYRF